MSKDYERLCATSEVLIYATMIRLMLRRLAHTRPFQTVSSTRLWCKTLFLPHDIMHRDMPYEGGDHMLRDRYEPMNLFALVSALSLALDPVLTQLDRVLDDDTLFQAVKADLAQRFPRTLIDGRPSTPVEVILRMLVVKHLYGWSDEATERWVSDSLVWRQFCRVYAAPVPDDTTLLRWANLIQPATLHRLLDHVVVLARSLKVTRGRKLRIDGTVVETTIHHPTDSTLLYDGVRVLSRTLAKAKQAIQEATRAWRAAPFGIARGAPNAR